MLKKLIISEISDTNIFHFLSSEILNIVNYALEVFNTTDGITVWLQYFDTNSKSHLWRAHLLAFLGFEVFTTPPQLSLYQQIIFLPPNTPWVIGVAPELEKLSSNQKIIKLFKQKIAENPLLKDHAVDILFVVRKTSRILFDNRTNRRIEEIVPQLASEFEVTCSIVDLEDLSPSEQFKSFVNAKNIVAVHGAALSNIVCCDNTVCTVWELNFRNIFRCDPVCNDHYFGFLTSSDECNAGTGWGGRFHKLDYIKLALMFNIRHKELDLTHSFFPFSRNPIDCRTVSIDLKNVFESVLSSKTS
jgi:hypothetical protein